METNQIEKKRKKRMRLRRDERVRRRKITTQEESEKLEENDRIYACKQIETNTKETLP